MISLQQIFTPVRAEMESLNDYYQKVLSDEHSALKNVLSVEALLEGKKLRSAMVFLCAGIFGKINHRTKASAFALELLHYASLIHDDVIDDGGIRHNHHTLNHVFGDKVAILTGDYLLAECIHFIVQEDYPELLTTVTSIAKTMVNGELLQLVKKPKRCLFEKEYMEIIRCKTAVFIAACFEMGVTSVVSDPETVLQWKKLGEKVGIIFQLKDDLLDYQSCHSLRKDEYKDIKDHKITLPFIHAFQQTPKSEKEKLLNFYLNHEGTNKEIQTITRIVKRRGGIDYVNELIDRLTMQCVNFIQLQEKSDYKEALLLLMQFIRERKF
jgi:octaprenyl-diphosphate synthase